MDGTLSTQPMRDPLYAPRNLTVTRRDDGSLILANPTVLEPPFETTYGALAHWAKATPHQVWLAERSGAGWRTVTYEEGRERVRAIAGGLLGLGLSRAGPLLILARNGIDHALVAYAAMSRATPIAPVSPQYGLKGADLSRLAHAVALLKPAAVYTEDTALFADALEADFLQGLPVIAGLNARAGDIALDDLLLAKPAPSVARGHDVAKYLLTSGSTGRPKAVIGLHSNIAINAEQIRACFTDDEPPVVVNHAPWSHSLGANAITQMVTHRGGTLYIDMGQPVAGRFAETVRNLKEISPTYHNFVPAGWDLMAHELERDPDLARSFFARLRLMQYGGAALAQSVADRIQAVALATIGETISFGSGYGATETGPTACNVHWPNLTMGLMGLPLPGTQVKLAPDGDKLEFRVKGPQVSPGYLNAPEATAAAFDEEGFYRLGDAARFVDPEEPRAGLAFDGRLSENFKLSNGTFVTAGSLRTAVVSAIGGAAADVVVCGENRETLGVLIFLNDAFARKLSGGDADGAHPAVIAAVREGLMRHNAVARGAGGRIGRALILKGAPDAASGEITEKGYINQALSRRQRAEDIERLFASEPEPDILVFT